MPPSTLAAGSTTSPAGACSSTACLESSGSRAMNFLLKLLPSVILAFMGAVMLYIGCSIAFRAWRFAAGAKRTPGIVVAYETTQDRDPDGDAVTLHHPVVEFSDEAGARRRARTGSG